MKIGFPGRIGAHSHHTDTLYIAGQKHAAVARRVLKGKCARFPRQHALHPSESDCVQKAAIADAFGDSVTQIFSVGVAGRVFKGQNGNRIERLARTRHARGGGPGFQVALEPQKIRPQFSSGLAAQLRFLFQRLVDDLFQLGRKVRVQADGGKRVAFENRVEDDRRTLAAEGQCACSHLVQHNTERK